MLISLIACAEADKTSISNNSAHLGLLSEGKSNTMPSSKNEFNLVAICG
jgi:hypothetical protein